LNHPRPNRQKPVTFVAVHPYARRFEMGPVLEIIHCRRGGRSLGKLERNALRCVANLTTAQLLTGLMGMTIIALGVAWEAGNEPGGVKLVATVALWCGGPGRHLSLVQMIRVREALESELGKF
jgi:hypothetical protein